MAHISLRTLGCGMPLIVETIPGVRSAALSWLIPAGTATDPEDRQGLSVLWSELVLRGAGALGSRGHADALDRLGVSRSTDLGPHHLRIAAMLVGHRLDEALPLIADMVLRPRMDPESIEPTRDLALQALASLKDDPQERAVLGARARHHPVPLNRSALGTEEGLRAASRDELFGGWAQRARPVGSILAIAGAVDADAAASRLDQLLKGWEGEAAAWSHGPPPPRGYAHEADDTNQVQIVVMHDAPPEPHADSILEKVTVAVLSGGMAGRLFSEVREKRGLCYSVSAGYLAGRDFGSILAYAGTTPERAQESLDVLAAELERIGRPCGVGDQPTACIDRAEFERAIIGMKSRLVFSGESTAARAGALAADQHRFGRPRSLDELAEQVSAVTLERVNNYLLARKLGRMTIQTLGPSALRPPAGA